MKHRQWLSTDLLFLLLVPIFVVTVVGAAVNIALPFVDWLLTHR